MDSVGRNPASRKTHSSHGFTPGAFWGCGKIINKQMTIIGITGTLGAGKTTTVGYIVSKYGFKHYSVRDFIVAEIQKRNLPLNRDSMVDIGNDLRLKRGAKFIMEELYNIAIKNRENSIIIESVRTAGEIGFLKSKQKFCIIALDADPKIRYQRVCLRNSNTDKVPFEKFMEDEKREMASSDSNKQNLALCIKNADFLITNNTSKKDLYEKINTITDKIKC